ncbi:hypothetical protein LZ023_36835 (plasmid) [Pseudomonas silvicola]|nr:hypothetical protein LZ023_36835 [Pseudomonas silvicola]
MDTYRQRLINPQHARTGDGVGSEGLGKYERYGNGSLADAVYASSV